MKNTGIVRRVDELGRIVLPKEVRSKMRIRAEDPMEIYVDNDKVILKKFSPIEEMTEISFMLTGIYKTLKCPILVCDLEKVVQLIQPPKGIFRGCPVTPELTGLIENRQPVVCTGEANPICPVADAQVHALAIQPILTAGGDLYGAVVMLAAKSAPEAGDDMILGAKILADMIAEYLYV